MLLKASIYHLCILFNVVMTQFKKTAILRVLKQCLQQLTFSDCNAYRNAKVQFEMLGIISIL